MTVIARCETQARFETALARAGAALRAAASLAEDLGYEGAAHDLYEAQSHTRVIWEESARSSSRSRRRLRASSSVDRTKP